MARLGNGSDQVNGLLVVENVGRKPAFVPHVDGVVRTWIDNLLRLWYTSEPICMASEKDLAPTGRIMNSAWAACCLRGYRR